MSIIGLILSIFLIILFLLVPASVFAFFLILGWIAAIGSIALGLVGTFLSVLLVPLIIAVPWVGIAAASVAVTFASLGFLLFLLMGYFTVLYFKFVFVGIKNIYSFSTKVAAA